MDTKLMIQSTPNPNALKFIVNTSVKTEGNYTYKSVRECEHNPLARALFEIGPYIREAYFFDNYITVTQDGTADWEELESKIRATILDKIKDHDPDFKVEEAKPSEKKAVKASPELMTIDEILNETVRPALQMDGGDLQVIDYEGNLLTISYFGACGSCPSATMGTLQAIENILKERFNPEIVVRLADFI